MKGKKTKERILENGLRAAREVGLQGVTFGKLAARMGMSKSGLYGHFKSKENLQLDIANAGIQRFTQVVVLPALKAPRGEPRLRNLIDNWMTWDHAIFMPTGRGFLETALGHHPQRDPLRDLMVKSQLNWLSTLAKAANIGINEGHFREDLDVDQFAFDIYSAVLCYHFMKRLFYEMDVECKTRGLLETLFEKARKHEGCP